MLTGNLMRAVLASAIFTLSMSFGFAQGDDNSNQQNHQQLQMQQGQSGQTDVSDEELKKFAGIMKDLQSLRQEQRPKMRQAIKDAGLTMQKYRTLQQQMQGQGGGLGGSQSKDQEKPTEEERQKFQKAQQEIQKVQQSMKKQMGKKIKENGLTENRFREISKAVRADKSLQQKLRKMQRSQGGGPGSQPNAR